MLTAHYKQRTATADITVLVKITEDLPTPATPANKAALQGAPAPDPGGANATKILYPYDGTVMPRGLSSPTLQFTPELLWFQVAPASVHDCCN